MKSNQILKRNLIFQQFTFVGFSSDVLEIEVKDRFAKSRPSISRFLGKRKIQLCTLMQERTFRYVFIGLIFAISDLFCYFTSEDKSIVLPLSISDPCAGSLHLNLEVKKPSDFCTSDPIANVANAAAASGASPPSPDSITSKYLTKANSRRNHNKVMSLARTCRRLSSTTPEMASISERPPTSMQTRRKNLQVNMLQMTPSPQKRQANGNQNCEYLTVWQQGTEDDNSSETEDLKVNFQMFRF